MQQYTYLLIHIFTVIICFIASFDSRLLFHKHFKTFLLSSTIVAVPFILWDSWFTKMGVWWFNTDYVTGYSFLGLPIEEHMFFWFIPFSCVFTYYVIDKYFEMNWLKSFNTILVFTSTIVLVVIAAIYHDKIYTFITALVTLGTLLFLHFIAKKEELSKASLVYFMLLPGFFAVNGVLTGTGLESPIVNYNSDNFLGIRILTIPIEDMVYGYSLILLNIYFFDLFKKKDKTIEDKLK